jgi:predicted polyphosphate/ATP-dependent NAD kinase
VTASLHIGVLVNPVAGLGGALGLKGSDGLQMRELAAHLSAEQRGRAEERALRALQIMSDAGIAVRYTCWAGAMGAQTLAQLGIEYTVLGAAATELTSAKDTREAARDLCAAGIDILLFAGGDGTARDILDAIGSNCPVLGIPAGVKMHSGVFAVSPEAAGEMLCQLATGGLVGLRAQEVRDIDEEAFRHDIVRSRFYGELLVPSEGQFLQHTKVGGREDPTLAAADIACWQAETFAPGRTYLIGPGSTTAAIMAELNLDNTLLGVDVVRDGELLAADVNAAQLEQMIAKAPGLCSIVVTAIGGQGHLFGRGNQQFSPAVIRAVGPDNVVIVATKSKIAALQGRPLLVDTNDRTLDLELSGYRQVNTGYNDYLLYRIAAL